MSKPFYTITDGLATLGPPALRLFERLEHQFLSWAAECGAQPLLFPSLTSVQALDRLDYFRNFPHLGSVVTRIRPECLQDYAKAASVSILPAEHLAPSSYIIPSAACYNVYLYLEDTTLDAPHYFTTVARCCRNEDRWEGLARLWGFTMREIVCVGDMTAVRAHLAAFKPRIGAFAEGAGLSLEVKTATDPFYDKSDSRAIMQQLSPVKEEFLYRGEVAIASLNYHRNFFGERCRIRTGDEGFAFSGCVAFGLERWLHAFFTQYGEDIEAIERAVDSGVAAADRIR